MERHDEVETFLRAAYQVATELKNSTVAVCRVESKLAWMQELKNPTESQAVMYYRLVVDT